MFKPILILPVAIVLLSTVGGNLHGQDLGESENKTRDRAEASQSAVGDGTVDAKSKNDVAKNYVAKDAVLKILEEREVPCLVSGVIKKNLVREGSLLREGQAVMEIDDAMVKLELEKLKKERDIAAKEASTEVELQYAKRSIEVSEADLNRAKRSNDRQPGAISRSEIDQLQLKVQRAIAEKDKTEFSISVRKMQTEVKTMEVSIGEKKLSDHKITSPITGMVVEILKKQGEWVEASEPVAKIIRLDKLKTEIKVPAAIALDNLVGSKAIFVPNLKSLAGKKYSATVIFIQPEANPVNASVRVWVEIENDNLDLVPGLTGKLTVSRNPSKEKSDQGSEEIGAVSNQ
ncbi:MAG: efflux RND transporter periplasmic adaptor subunit [Mariniblastus sp.]